MLKKSFGKGRSQEPGKGKRIEVRTQEIVCIIQLQQHKNQVIYLLVLHLEEVLKYYRIQGHLPELSNIDFLSRNLVQYSRIGFRKLTAVILTPES